MKKVGVVLSGCGVMDGSEIHESVLALLALDRAGAEAVCAAPNIKQHHVINHLNNELDEGRFRNVLTEAARIARGKIRDLAKLSAADIDALVFPGGYGAAKNLSTFAFDGERCHVDPEVDRIVREMHQAGKPIGFICISPALGAKILGEHKVKLTIGNDKQTAQTLMALGAVHQEAKAADIVVDEKNRVVSTPAYMCARSISEAATGIEALVQAVLKMTDKKA
ncbi:MAG: isoprenoid biosynthesis glyoxalase ElbB [Verrucomicrobiae bacterium]|nr:isoprenoid biosynthesis glyoxalase ElbB [Verrucomicrobiae bacterium]